jgi:predicted ATPase/class 3 adenylate cyclase
MGGMSAVAQPSGTVSLVFTDIEGSTRLLEELGTDAYREALGEHRRVVREACARFGGYEVDFEGDAFFFAFASASDAVGAVAAFMAGLEPGPIRVRVGIHTGEPALDPPKYVGLDVHRAARIMSCAHGGQVVLSPSTVALLEPGAFALWELGQHRLKDLSSPIPLHQLLVDGLAQEFPPLKTLYRSNLPIPATPFLGREAELAEVVGRLTDPDTRLLTLTGPGGTGKTRLALQAAAEVADAFPDGVFWVPLAPLRDPSLVGAVVAAALGVADVERSPVETVVSALGRSRCLVVLDNCEHVLDAVRGVVSDLVAGTGIRILATTRETLRVTGERVLPVAPLGAEDAVELFRARVADAGAVVGDGAGEAVARICARLDRLPLAVELAAARVPLLGVEGLERRLDRALPALDGGALDADERQRTLRATIAWSVDLLEPDEREALARLSVFAGGCRLDAVESVCDADAAAVESLLAKSLVRRRFDRDGEPRIWLLETIREYAAGLLDAGGERDAVQDAHALWYAQLTEPDWNRGYPPAAWYTRMEPERDNMRTAFERLAARGDWAALAPAVGRYSYQWFAAGVVGEQLDWVERCLPHHVYPDDVRSALLEAAAFTRMVAGDFARSIRDADAALALARELGDPHTLVRALTLRGSVAWADPGSAKLRLEEALELAERIGFPEGSSLIQSALGSNAMNDGRYDDAVGHLRASLEGPLDSPQVRSVDLGTLAGALLLRGSHEAAVPCVHEALALAQVHDLAGTVYTALAVVACLLSERGEPTTAVALVAAVCRLMDQGGSSAVPEATWEGRMLADADAIARGRSDPELVGAAVAASAGWTWDDAVAVALQALEALEGAGPASEASGRAEPEDREALA